MNQTKSTTFICKSWVENGNTATKFVCDNIFPRKFCRLVTSLAGEKYLYG